MNTTHMTLLTLLNLAALVASVYCCGAAVCRVRHGRHLMRAVWLLLYVAIFALAAWTAADILHHGIAARDAITSVFVGLYVKITAASWAHGVPSIAQRSRAEPFADTSLPKGST